jgi:diguanylate cyclase (GGDEF)-like protein/PAS domain S-box-containing protein
MVLGEGTLTPAVRPRRMVMLLAGAVVTAAVLAPLVMGAVPISNLRFVAAVLATVIVLRGVGRAGSPRELRVRRWIAAAVVVWTGSELARVVGIDPERQPIVAAATVAGLAVAAIGTYVSAARGRMRPPDEAALYLDAASIFFAITGAVLVIGATLVHDPVGLAILVHAAFFVAVVGATLLLDLATHVPLRFVGPWEVLVGLSLGAAGYIGLFVPGTGDVVRVLLHATVATGVVLVAHGGANWNATEAVGRRYAAVSAWLRGLLPVSSAVLTGALIVVLVGQPTLVEGMLRLATGVALGLVAVCGIARQTVLLADRERVLTRERQLSDELTVAEAQYRSVVERVPGVVYVAEAGQHGRWHFVSSKIEELLGYTPEEWMSDPTLWIDSMHPADRDRMILAETGDGERSGAIGRWEYRLRARDGRYVWVIDDEAVISRDGEGRATMVQGILVDISDRKDLEEQLRHQALHDPLTGLPNRVLFVDRLAHALVRRGDGSIAVLFLDLDEFKAINDTLGHAAGDELLHLVAGRLTHVMRAEDTACRLGGDEFAFLLEEGSRVEATAVATRILDALAEPFDVAGRRATLTASIGIAVAERGSHLEANEFADELLRDADTAMYAAKALGKSRMQVFERGMDEPVKRRRELRTALERAIESDELFLEYQPIVDMRDGAVIGVESLVRWNHPQLGRLVPGDFITLAEESNLIAPLGAWVMQQAAVAAAATDTLVSVNVSAHQLRGDELSTLVRRVLDETGLRADRLLLELTEWTLASAGEGVEDELGRIQAMGVRIALDDFGSGYNSLEYLGRLPIDILKIDMSLVERIHLDPQRREVLRAIGHIADKLGLEMIVEGVELEEQRLVLLELGFVQAQGWLFAPALPLAEALVPRWTAVARAS